MNNCCRPSSVLIFGFRWANAIDCAIAVDLVAQVPTQRSTSPHGANLLDESVRLVPMDKRVREKAPTSEAASQWAIY